MGGNEIPQKEMITLVRDVLDGEDLSQMTLKIVRKQVLDKLGKRREALDMVSFKACVKAALSTVLETAAQALENPKPNDAAVAAPNVKSGPSPGKPEKSHSEDGKDGHAAADVSKSKLKPKASPKAAPKAKAGAKGVKGAAARSRVRRKVVKEEEEEEEEEKENDDDVGGDDASEDDAESDGGGKSDEKTAKQPSQDEKDDEDNLADDDEDFVVAQKKTKSLKRKNAKDIPVGENNSKKRARTTKGAQGEQQESSMDASSSEDYKNSSERKRKVISRAPRRSSGAKSTKRRERSSGTAPRSKLGRLNAVVRNLGLRLPTFRFKGKDEHEKYGIVLEFLQTKGITTDNPTALTKSEIAKHRSRLEREKDLVGIDVGNIIEEEGRPRRRAAAVASIKESDGKLPSDLSGADLSVEEEENDEAEYAMSSEASD